MRSNRLAQARAILLWVVVALVGCGETAEPPASQASIPPGSATPMTEPKDDPPADRCTEYPPPFEASYLPRGFDNELRRGTGLFGRAADAYPTEGLLGHYRGPVETVHANFETRPGPLPYEPANTHPLRGVLGRRGEIGKIEGGWAVEFSLDNCDFRMDTYGIDRAETVEIAKGLHERN